MTKKQKALAAIEALKKEYPDAECALIHSNPLQLLIATRLSAQCTDARVNMVTPALFERFPTIDDFINSSEEEIAEYIRTCGLFKTKARDIFAMCKKLKEEFNGIVPDNMEDLLSLPGVGRKTANLILGDVYGKPAVVTDTHFIRIMDGMEVSVGGSIFTIPIHNIRQSFKIHSDQLVHDAAGGEIFKCMGSFYPVVRMRELYQIEEGCTQVEDGILIWLEAGELSYCLFVDELLGEQQVVVKPLPSYLNSFNIKRSGIAGCTILGDGNISIILDVANLYSPFR